MKNNTDLFIKYLDDQLSADQRKEFEQSLVKDQNFKFEFENYAQVYKSIKKTIEVDERYFATLLPNVRERMEKNSQNYLGKLAYILPVLILGTFIIYFINTSTNKLDENLISVSELLETDENISYEDLDNILELNKYSNLNDQILEIYFNDNLEMDSTLFDYLESNLAANEISNSFLEELSENEFNLIYQDLEKNKIIGEK
jgi:hypothetical protein